MCFPSFQVKAAFTRTYNKEVHLTPYSLQAIKKGRRGGAEESELEVQDAEKDAAPVSEDEGESLSVDAMIKVMSSKVLTGSIDPSQSYICLFSSHSRRRPKPSPRSLRRKRLKILGRGRERPRLRLRLKSDLKPSSMKLPPDHDHFLPFFHF